MQTCLSLFSGAGGFDLGASKAGLNLLASIEMDSACCKTLAKNFTHKVVEADVSKVSPHSLRKQLKLRKGELDFLIAGPPCQPFSKSAFWARGAAQGMKDERANTLRTLFEFVQEFKPSVVIIENVEGFKSGGGLDFSLTSFEKIGGYSVNYKTLLASDFGVPQKRRRLFLVAWRKKIQFDFPKATHGPDKLPEVSSWEALVNRGRNYDEDLKPLGKWSDLLPSIPEGANYLWHTEKGGGKPLFGWRTRYWSFLQKLAKGKPSPTIVASPSQNSGPFHWDNRRLSTDELASLQTFPEKFHFVGNRPERQKQIGNAVPPLLAKVLIAEIQSQLGNHLKTNNSLNVPRLKHIPKPTKIKEVPEKFEFLVGVHPPHPGTGRGPRPREVVSK